MSGRLGYPRDVGTAGHARLKMRLALGGICLGIVVFGVVAVANRGTDRPVVVSPSRSVPRPAPPSALAVAVSRFAAVPRFAPDSFWYARVDDRAQRLDPSSAALAAHLADMAEAEELARSGPWINTRQYSVPVYEAGPDQPLTPVRLNRPDLPFAARLRAAFAAGVPIPAGARPAAGNDAHMVVWQPSTDTMWEFWHLRRSGTDWQADWGGVMHQVSRDPGVFRGEVSDWGATATSLPLVGGLITPAELRRGVIDHALALAIPQTRAGRFAAPAQRSDGRVAGPGEIPEGARLRLDPAVDVDSLGLPPLTLMLARAAQRYGIIVRDNAGVVTFFAQDPTPTGGDPYRQLFGARYPSTPLASFPWRRLQVLAMQLHGDGP